MPAGTIRRYRKKRTLPSIPRRGLNVTEQKQTKQIARQVVNKNIETKYRNFLYPKTEKNQLNHNVVHILFGEDQQNGLLNTKGADGGGTGAQSRPIPAGDGVPYQKPGDIREGTKMKVLNLRSRIMLSSAGETPSLTVRMVYFSYPCIEGISIGEADLLAQPTGTGVGQGWPNILLELNRWNAKGIKFLGEKYFTMSGQPCPGAVAIEGTAPNFGEGPSRVVSFNKYWKNGLVVKYREQGDTTLPQYRNIGMFFVASGNYTTPEGQSIGNFEMNCGFSAKDI